MGPQPRRSATYFSRPALRPFGRVTQLVVRKGFEAWHVRHRAEAVEYRVEPHCLLTLRNFVLTRVAGKMPRVAVHFP